MSQCLIITREIRELTNKLVGETEESTKTLIELWQQKNNKAPDEYPTAKELAILRDELRGPKEEANPVNASAFDTVITSVAEQEEVDRVFDPVTRRDRVTLIARLFSNEVDKAVDEYRENLREKMAEADPLTNLS